MFTGFAIFWGYMIGIFCGGIGAFIGRAVSRNDNKYTTAGALVAIVPAALYWAASVSSMVNPVTVAILFAVAPLTAWGVATIVRLHGKTGGHFVYVLLSVGCSVVVGAIGMGIEAIRLQENITARQWLVSFQLLGLLVLMASAPAATLGWLIDAFSTSNESQLENKS